MTKMENISEDNITVTPAKRKSPNQNGYRELIQQNHDNISSWQASPKSNNTSENKSVLRFLRRRKNLSRLSVQNKKDNQYQTRSSYFTLGMSQYRSSRLEGGKHVTCVIIVNYD